VLEDTTVMHHWRIPEDFPAAACVPVSTSNVLLGTLWVFSKERRAFTQQETNLLEVVAGRLASDLEREMLLRVGIDGARVKKQMAAAERLQQHQLPSFSPMFDGWELAGWTNQAGGIGGDFHDWFCLPDGLVAVALGDAGDTTEQGLAAALAGATLKAALRSHGQYHGDPEQVLQKANLTLWTSSAGDQFAKALFGLIETLTGRVTYAVAGKPGVLFLERDGWQSLTFRSPRLGEGPETDYRPVQCCLESGEALVMITDGVYNAADTAGRRLGEANLAEPLFHLLGLSANELVRAARDILYQHAGGPPQDDCTILVVKRT